MTRPVRLLISSGRGPAECEMVVTRLAWLLTAEAQAEGIRVATTEQTPGSIRDSARSVVLEVAGPQASAWAARQSGPVCWTAPSPLRPAHRRKNWFVEVSRLDDDAPPPAVVRPDDVRFEPVRGSGPGGQHRNKVATGVRATHLPTGIVVVATDARSQQANRASALERLQHQLTTAASRREQDLRTCTWQRHGSVTRGDAVRHLALPLE